MSIGVEKKYMNFYIGDIKFVKGIAFHADEKGSCSRLLLQGSPDVPVQLTVLAQNAPPQSRLREPAPP